MGKLTEQIMQGLGSGIGGATIGLLGAGWQDARQIRQQRKLNALALEANKAQGETNMAQSLEMWKKTGAPAQRKMLEEAGLNVGLMYSGTGAGGATTQAGNVGGANAAGGSGEVGMGIEKGMQLALMKAQKENIEADTEQKKASVPVSGADVTLKGAQEAKTKQETANLKIDEDIKRFQKDQENVAAHIAKNTIDVAMQKLASDADIAMHNAKIALIQGEFDEHAYNAKLEQVRQILIKTMAEAEAIKEGTQFNYGTSAEVARWTSVATEAIGNILIPFKAAEILGKVTGGDKAKQVKGFGK